MTIQSLRTDDCIDAVFEEYSDMIFRLAFSHVKTRTDAMDICHEVFMRYIKKNMTFECEEHRKKWLVKATVNCCKSFFHSAWYRRCVPAEEYEQASQTPFEAFDIRADVHNALSKIPGKYRTVIHLFYFEKMSVKEIANTLDLKESTVKSQLMRARNMLHDLLKGEYFSE